MTDGVKKLPSESGVGLANFWKSISNLSAKARKIEGAQLGEEKGLIDRQSAWGEGRKKLHISTKTRYRERYKQE